MCHKVPTGRATAGMNACFLFPEVGAAQLSQFYADYAGTDGGRRDAYR